VIYLDTHAVVWLYAGQSDRFPEAAQRLMETEPLLISPAVVLELQYLHETGKLTCDASVIVESLQATIGLEVCTLPFHAVVVEALRLDWTRDPFDRLIAAQARAANAPLITKDEAIRQRFPAARWDRD
jgi:PIN domain nuclease of toxin-antitoxin system